MESTININVKLSLPIIIFTLDVFINPIINKEIGSMKHSSLGMKHCVENCMWCKMIFYMISINIKMFVLKKLSTLICEMRLKRSNFNVHTDNNITSFNNKYSTIIINIVLL